MTGAIAHFSFKCLTPSSLIQSINRFRNRSWKRIPRQKEWGRVSDCERINRSYAGPDHLPSYLRARLPAEEAITSALAMLILPLGTSRAGVIGAGGHSVGYIRSEGRKGSGKAFYEDSGNSGNRDKDQLKSVPTTQYHKGSYSGPLPLFAFPVNYFPASTPTRSCLAVWTKCRNRHGSRLLLR